MGWADQRSFHSLWTQGDCSVERQARGSLYKKSSTRCVRTDDLCVSPVTDRLVCVCVSYVPTRKEGHLLGSFWELDESEFRSAVPRVL